MSDEYANVSRGKLKLKTDSEIKKKKKKRDKDKEKLKEKIEKTDASTVVSSPPKDGRQLTKAEKSFKKMQEKMVSKIYAFFISFSKRSRKRVEIQPIYNQIFFSGSFHLFKLF